MSRKRSAWRTFLDAATVFSFVLNLLLLLALLAGVNPLLRVKAAFAEPMVDQLDRAFQHLGETTVEATVPVDDAIGIRFDLPLDQPLDLDFDLPISQETVVVLTEPVPLSDLPARFALPGGGGVINGSVSLTLPAGLRLPIRLEMVVPVEQTIPVEMTVPVSQTVPVRMEIPVRIPLGEAGLDPVVQELREAIRPLKDLLHALPDRLRVGGEP